MQTYFGPRKLVQTGAHTHTHTHTYTHTHTHPVNVMQRLERDDGTQPNMTFVQRRINVDATSCHDVASMLMRRCTNVMCRLGLTIAHFKNLEQIFEQNVLLQIINGRKHWHDMFKKKVTNFMIQWTNYRKHNSFLRISCYIGIIIETKGCAFYCLVPVMRRQSLVFRKIYHTNYV